MARALDGFEFGLLCEVISQRSLLDLYLHHREQGGRRHDAVVRLQYVQKGFRKYRIALSTLIQDRFVAARRDQKRERLGSLNVT